MYNMKNKIDSEELDEKISDLKEEIEKLDSNDNEEEYNEFLDDTYGSVNVAGYKYDTSYVLKEIDPTAYSVGHSDFNNSRLTEAQEELESLEQELRDLEE